MPGSSFGEVLRLIRSALDGSGVTSLSDAQLLERFFTQRDERAFTVLVERHGPMVLSVCKRIMGDAHQSEDAFQAAFLVLIRKTTSLTGKQSVGGWLHGVARRVALRARAQNALRRQKESEATVMSSTGPLDELNLQELRAVLDEEIASLSEKYQGPIVLCHLEGKTYDEAAHELGCTKITLSRRLTKARALLRRKLERRGITLSLATLATALTEAVQAAPLPAFLALNTVKAATLVATGKTAAGGCLSAGALALAEEALTGMLLAKGKLVIMVMAVGLAIGGAGWAGYRGLAEKAQPGPVTNAQQVGQKKQAEVKEKEEPPSATDLYGDPLATGSTMRLGTSRYRHGTPIVSLGVSEDGLVAVAASGARMNGSVRVFDLETGLVRTILRSPTNENAQGVALSPDGRILAINESLVIHFRDALSGKKLRSINTRIGNTGTITAWTLFTPDGKSVAVATSDGHGIHLLDVETATIVRTFKHENTVYAAAFSRDGKLLAGGGYENDKRDYFVRLWEVATGQELRRFTNGPADIRALAFSPDGKILAGGGRNAQLRLWDVETGKELRTHAPDGNRIRSIAFTPDGKSVAAAGDTIRLYDPLTGKERLHIDRQAIGLSFSADGKVLTGAVMGTIYRWDATTGRQLTPQAAGDSIVEQIIVSTDGRHIITRGEIGDAHIWEAQTGAPLRYLNATFQRGIALSPDGRFLVWPVADDKIKFKDPAMPSLIQSGNRIRLYEIGADRFIDRFPGFEGDAQYLAFAPDGKTLVTVNNFDGGVRIWDVATGKELRSFRVVRDNDMARPHFVRHTVLAPDGKTLAVTYQPFLSNKKSPGGLVPYSVRLWNVATGKELHDLPGHNKYVEGMAFSPDSRFVVTGGEPFLEGRGGPANQVYVWEVATGRRVATLPDGLTNGATSVAYAPNGWTFATAAADGTIRLWEVASYTIRAEFRGHRDKITSLAFHQDGRLLSGSVDTTVLAWDVCPPLEKPGGSLAAAWDALLKPEGVLAFKAMGRLRSTPTEAVALLAERLKPAEFVDPKHLVALIADIESEVFAKRDAAMKKLAKLGELAEPALSQALDKAPVLETRNRIKQLLGRLPNIGTSGEPLRQARAVEVLENIWSPQARQLLEKLAAGAAQANLTRDAQATVERLKRR